MAAGAKLAALEVQAGGGQGFAARTDGAGSTSSGVPPRARIAVSEKPLASRVTGNRPSGRRAQARTPKRRHSA